MIFVSTSCVKHKYIKNSVEELAENGFQNIELSGGTKYYKSFEKDLIDLKNRYGLTYRCHNYFPPPKQPFVLNLASLNEDTFEISFNHLKDAIALSERLGAQKFGFHAGFFIDIKIKEIGKKLTKDNLFNKEKAINRFCAAYSDLEKNIGKNISLYIENNVFSKTNSRTYEKENPFMLTNYKDFKMLKEIIDFNLLLDVAHLKVSSKTLGLDWLNEFKNMIDVSDYIHVSDNDGYHDTNNQLFQSSSMLNLLQESDTSNKDFTIEVYDGMSALKESYKLLSEVI